MNAPNNDTRHFHDHPLITTTDVRSAVTRASGAAGGRPVLEHAVGAMHHFETAATAGDHAAIVSELHQDPDVAAAIHTITDAYVRAAHRWTLGALLEEKHPVL